MRRRAPKIAAGALALSATLMALHPAGAWGGPISTHTIGQPITVGSAGNEPIVTGAPDGTLYISALEHLYVSTDNGASWAVSPGTIYNNTTGNGGVNLNSDSSISVDPGGRLYFSFDYPYAGTTAVCVSDNRAQTFSCNATALPGGTDRMWVVAPSTTAAYMVTNQGLEQTIFFSSLDRGATWTPHGTATAVANSDTGPLLKSPVTGLIFQPYVNNATNATATTNLNSGPLAFHVWNPATMLSTEVTTPLTGPNALPIAGFSPDGTLYVASEEPRTGGPTGYQLSVARSTDQGAHWTVLPPLPGTTTGTQTFSALSVGSDGHVGVLYYTTAAGGDPNAEPVSATWDTVWAETVNGADAAPTWATQTIDTNVHQGTLCSTVGCNGDGRYSGDFIGSWFDSADQPHLTWMKDLDTTGNNVRVRYAGSAIPTASTPEFPFAPLALIAGALGAGVLARRRRLTGA